MHRAAIWQLYDECKATYRCLLLLSQSQYSEPCNLQLYASKIFFIQKWTVKENMCLGFSDCCSCICLWFWANMVPHSYLCILYFIYHRILLWGQLLQFSSCPGCLHLPLVATDQDWSAEWAVVTGCRNGGLPVPRAPERENTGECLKNWRSLTY